MPLLLSQSPLSTLDHASGDAGYATVGEQVGRVCPNAVNTLVWYAREHLRGLTYVERRVFVGRYPEGFGSLAVREFYSDRHLVGCIVHCHSERIVDQIG